MRPEVPVVDCAAVATSVLDAYNRRDWTAIEAACAPTISFHDRALNLGGDGREKYLEYWQQFSAAITNQIISDVTVESSEVFTAVTTLTCSGDHDGADFLPGFPAKHAHVQARLCALWRCDEQGLLVRNEWFWDLLTVLRCLGQVDLAVR